MKTENKKLLKELLLATISRSVKKLLKELTVFIIISNLITQIKKSYKDILTNYRV